MRNDSTRDYVAFDSYKMFFFRVASSDKLVNKIFAFVVNLSDEEKNCFCIVLQSVQRCSRTMNKI